MNGKLLVLARIRCLLLIAFSVVFVVGCGQPGGPEGQPEQAVDLVVVEMVTELGRIELELYPTRAPITTKNFLRYVDGGLYDGSSFYRAVRLDNQPQSEVLIEVIQGGLGMTEMTPENPPVTFEPIPHETTEVTGILHEDGTISMARLEPGSASSEFFICIGDQPSLDFGGLRNPDGQGFAAFGKVTAGMDVVRQIQRIESAAPVNEELAIVRGQMLTEPVPILSLRRQ